MSRILHILRATNDLIYTTLRGHDSELLASGNNDLSEEQNRERNARAFLDFELAIHSVSGNQEQLEAFTARQESIERSKSHKYGKVDPIWTQALEVGVQIIAQGGSRVQNIRTAESPEQEDIDDPVKKVGHYTDFMTRTGIADGGFRHSLIPLTFLDLFNRLESITRFNKLVEWLFRQNIPPVCIESVIDGESVRLATRTDALYNLLAGQQCGAEGHRALLQLSNWGSCLRGKEVFEMFLSVCSQNSWQKTSCAFESAELGNQIETCHHVKKFRALQSPLLLSFNNHRLWKTNRVPSRFVPEHQMNPKCISFETLLINGDFKTSNLDTSIKKFRLAFRLAMSLYSLHSGPWVQGGWDSHRVCFIPGKSGKVTEVLDEAYISCDLMLHGGQTPHILKSPQQPRSGNGCPGIFLSLAQLLVDIASGENNRRSLRQDDPDSWWNSLAKECRNNTELNDELMEGYWNAVHGCLFYLEHYNSLVQDTRDERLRGQQVIYNNIVRHLQKHLGIWEEQKARGIKYAESHKKASQTHSRTHFSAGEHRISDGSSASAAHPCPRGKSTYETSFILWSDDDENCQRVERPITTLKETCFMAHMNKFLSRYIELKATQNESCKRVRVAIIDTGFYIEGEELNSKGMDPFLIHEDVRSRVVCKRNFFASDENEPNPADWKDEHGHGTHVARLLLQFAPRAEVVVAKISNSKTLRTTKTTQLVEALKWAGENADIINMSFSLGEKPERQVDAVIEDLIGKRKLIFVSASNQGGFNTRPWPANRRGVFAIHATNEFGVYDNNMNPSPASHIDNFATWGCNIESYWGGSYRSISGTSFATPVAAAIAANTLDFARRTQPEEIATDLTRYRTMRQLFRDHMAANKLDGFEHVLLPWKKGLWDGDEEDFKNISNVLLTVTTY